MDVYDLFEKGLDQRDQIIGVHGTAWESIAVLHETGFLPPTLNKNLQRKGAGINDHRDGCVYFFPLREHFATHKNEAHFPDTLENAVDAAHLGYAKRIARELALVTAFGLDVHSPRIRDLADRATRQKPRKFEPMDTFFKNRQSSNLYSFLKEKGYSDDDIRNEILKALQREGIVVALRKTILDVFELHEDATDHESIAVVCPKGLPLEHICGIEPCGEYEYEKLASLEQ